MLKFERLEVLDTDTGHCLLVITGLIILHNQVLNPCHIFPFSHPESRVGNSTMQVNPVAEVKRKSLRFIFLEIKFKMVTIKII